MNKKIIALLCVTLGTGLALQATFAANPVSQKIVNDLFCHLSTPLPGALCSTSGNGHNPASQQYVCERYLAAVAVAGPPVALGDQAGNGKVFYIDPTNRRGLIVADNDAGSGLGYLWSDVNIGAGATNPNLFGGKANTDAILITPGTNDAAVAARSYPVSPCPATIQCESAYSLPSTSELFLMYIQQQGGISPQTSLSSFYWASTEYDTNQAWGVGGPTSATIANKTSNFFKVRPVRAFTY